MKKSDQILKQVDDNIEEPFVTAKFGNNWKQHTKNMLEEGQMDIDSVIEIAWKQGRRALLMERVIHSLCEKNF